MEEVKVEHPIKKIHRKAGRAAKTKKALTTYAVIGWPVALFVLEKIDPKTADLLLKAVFPG